MTVTKFLMSNLAFADLCLGLYLMLIAAMDVHSIGEYFNYGYEWQYGMNHVLSRWFLLCGCSQHQNVS